MYSYYPVYIAMQYIYKVRCCRPVDATRLYANTMCHSLRSVLQPAVHLQQLWRRAALREVAAVDQQVAPGHLGPPSSTAAPRLLEAPVLVVRVTEHHDAHGAAQSPKLRWRSYGPYGRRDHATERPCVGRPSICESAVSCCEDLRAYGSRGASFP